MMLNRKRPILLIALAVAMAGCSSARSDSDASAESVDSTVNRAVDHLVFLEGGTFRLGDIGAPEDSPYTTLTDDNKPPVSVALDSYSISKYETTWEDFVVFLKDVGRLENYTVDAGFVMANKLPITASDDPSSPNFYKKPARSPNYSEAESYCAWLADQSGLPFALPTEAQWEYAARSRGEDVAYATNDGTMENDTYLQRPDEYVDPTTPPSGNALSHSSLKTERRPVGSYPPNPVGLYDMTGNVSEWTSDWYAENAYHHMAAKNPQGPDAPTDSEHPQKVVRDWAGLGEHAGGGDTVFMRGGRPVNDTNNGFRCVVNRASQVN
ncbi:formylglycine-generating enzyme family protein [Marinobacter sp. JSM 1782161]|uniref:formylglycine-generating enzyme family protein n=1 Tax=Marinobacter sp. JSM 1782161 TaxID=2685906 RepID=UPI001402114A|nr:SUMF1/EgtB/PvdO family nonheme iron enzyme [Marinobacter sp. JSM 1782161]